MLLAGAYKEVAPAIVGSVSTDVVNGFPTLENPSELLLSYKAMLIVPAAAKCFWMFWYKAKYVPILDTPLAVMPFLNRYVLYTQSLSLLVVKYLVAHCNPVEPCCLGNCLRSLVDLYRSNSTVESSVVGH